jgi:hypothetical protein
VGVNHLGYESSGPRQSQLMEHVADANFLADFPAKIKIVSNEIN